MKAFGGKLQDKKERFILNSNIYKYSKFLLFY